MLIMARGDTGILPHDFVSPVLKGAHLLRDELPARS